MSAELRLLPGTGLDQAALLLASAPAGARILLENAAYAFDGRGAYRGWFAPSNNQTGEKQVAFPLLGKKGLHLDGQGAVITFRDRLFPFILQDCQDVILENFTLDFSFPRYAVAVLTESDAQGLTLEIDPARYPFRVEADGALAFQAGSQWRSTREKKFFLASPAGAAPSVYLVAGDTADPLTNLAAPVLRTDAALLAPGRVRLRYRAGSPRLACAPGAQLILSHDEDRENDVFFLERCKNVTLRHIRVLRGAGMGVVGQLCENVCIDGMRIAPDPARQEPLSITADAFHFLHCSGDLIIRRCEVRHSLDDAVNIHGIYTQAVSVSGHEALVRLGHQEQYGFNPYCPGDEVDVLREGRAAGRLRIAASRLTPDGAAIALSFAQTAEGTLCPGDYLDNPGRMPRVLLEGNVFEDCPRVLLSSPQPMRVAGNDLRLCGALTLIGGVDYWFESGMVRQALITGNRFSPLGKPHPAMEIRVNGGGAQRHEHITITENRLSGASLLLSAAGARGLTLRGNRSDQGDCEIRLRGCEDVRLDN